MRRILFSPDGGEGGTSKANEPSKDAAAPPAASTVMQSDAKEGDAAELVELKRKLEDEKQGRKKDQTRLSELEDENRRLKTPPAPTPAPAAAEQKKRFMDGWTFFDK